MRKPKTDDDDSPLTMSATIPLIKSAVLIGGDVAATLKLEVPECDMEQVKRLLDLRGQVLRVTVEVE